MTALPQALCVATPVVLGGLTHVAVIRVRVWPRLAALPLDGGACWRGRRILGENKTWRGVLVMVAATALWTGLVVWLIRLTGVGTGLTPPAALDRPLLWGTLAGVGYVAGELPNSFVKRQLGIAAGDTRGGWTGPLLWTVDQIDSVAGVLLALLPVWQPDLAVVLALFTVTLVVHPAVALVMYLLGLKTRIG